MTRKATQLDIYFHMANHYRKLQSVKSVVDTSAPTGYYEKQQGGRQSRPPSRAEKRRQYTSKSLDVSNRLYDKNRFDIVKHDCLNKRINSTVRSQSLPPRPPTRRKPSDMPTPREFFTRARSSGPTARKGNNTQKLRSTRSQRSANATPICANSNASVKTHSNQNADQMQINASGINTVPIAAPRNTKPKRNAFFKNSISDHEYLQFSLRITEDIIRNDLYTNKEMRRVFNSHLEANRGRLDMERMIEQINNLCKELNIPIDDETKDDVVTKSQMRASRQTVKSSLACICSPTFRPINTDYRSCECSSARRLPFPCVQHANIESTADNSTHKSSILKSGDKFAVREQNKDKSSRFASPVFDEDFVEAHFFENPENDVETSLSNPSIASNENKMYQDIPQYDDKEHIMQVRQSVGCIELPSLSRVTEKTEPTTSCESVDTKLETPELNIDSASEFDAADVLPGFEHMEESEQIKPLAELSLSNDSKKENISFKSDMIKLLCANSSQISNKASVHCMNYVSEKIALTEPKILYDHVECWNENSNWLICSCDTSQQLQQFSKVQSNDENTSPSSNSDGATTIKGNTSVNQSQIRMVYSAPPILQTRTEPIKIFNKAPIPTPRSCSVEETGNINNFQFERKLFCGPSNAQITKPNNVTKNKIPLCVSNEKTDNVKVQVLKIPEKSNIKIRGLNNHEEEFVLVPGPIYVPKSSILPAKERNSILINAPKTLVKRDNLKFSKDAMVNTDEQMLCNSNQKNELPLKLNVIKEPNISSNASSCKSSFKSNPSVGSSLASWKNKSSDTTTYSQFHTAALNSVHYTSFSSDISHISNGSTPQSTVLAEEILKSLNEPPRAVLKCKQYISAPTPTICSNKSCTLTQLNDYDLTPQRDSNNKDRYSNEGLDEPVSFNKGSLLLGDEYEIKDNFSFKSSTTSCYNNGLPNTICKFYPNISTQTHSSDFLTPLSFNTNKTENDEHKEDYKQEQQKPEESQKSQEIFEMQIQEGPTEQQNLDGHQELIKTVVNEEESAKNQFRFNDENKIKSEMSLTKIVSFEEDDDDEDFLGLLGIKSEEGVDKKMDILEKKGEVTVQLAVEEKKYDQKQEEKNQEYDEDAEVETEEADNKGEDILKTLDETPSIVHHASMILTLEQVKNDLERFRKTEIPVEEFVQTRYNIPNRSLVVADDLQQQSSYNKAVGSIEDERKNNNVESSEAKLPFIEVEKSEIEVAAKKEPSNELNHTICCGLKKIKKKKRRDIVDLDESLHNMPNISTIPDDQLFEVEPRRPTVASVSGYGDDRKSLRFDYSPMSEFSQQLPDENVNLNRRDTIDIKDFTSLSSANVTPPHSSDLLPAVRNPVVSYRSSSVSAQSSSDKKASAVSGVSFDSNIVTVENRHNSVVDILPPTQAQLSMTSVQLMENPENEVKWNSESKYNTADKK